jgi:hypothetical protein
LNLSVISSVKSPVKTSTSANQLFFLILNIPSVISSIYTDRSILSVYPTELYTEKISSVIMTANYRQNYSVGNSVGIKRISGSGKRVI